MSMKEIVINFVESEVSDIIKALNSHLDSLGQGTYIQAISDWKVEVAELIFNLRTALDKSYSVTLSERDTVKLYTALNAYSSSIISLDPVPQIKKWRLRVEDLRHKVTDALLEQNNPTPINKIDTSDFASDMIVGC